MFHLPEAMYGSEFVFFFFFSPGSFLPEEISKSCPSIVIVNGFWFCFNFHGNRKICFLTVFEYKSLISLGSFEYISLHFYPLKCFEPLSFNSLTSFSFVKSLFPSSGQFFFPYFLYFSDTVWFSVLIAEIQATFYT